MTPALLAEVWRGDAVELLVRGHLAVVDAAGGLVASLGDPDAPTTLRSAVKPLQALPFVEDGALEALDAGAEELALACGSHSGEPVHVATARRLLARAGLDEGQLACGRQWPAGDEAARALAAAGGQAGRIHNNCSGKHAAMLAACVHAGWPVQGYTGIEHPLQRRITTIMGEVMAVDLGGAPHGIDGCGLPTYGLPLRALARGFAAAQEQRSAFRRCQDAMAAHPHLVGGAGRFDTALLDATGTTITAKSGGAAVWAAVAREDRLGIALKLEAGGGAQLAPIAMAVLGALDLLPAELAASLGPHAAGAVHNWEGTVVGETRVVARPRRR